ncbi:hypothetical protein [Streptosporangium roseum]|uniref:hypothetical protein n=1 Tax=Streptosporangium roseum TaxID=2001 RepID=UPI003319370C
MIFAGASPIASSAFTGWLATATEDAGAGTPEDVGVVTGDLTIRTEVHGGQAAVRVQYTGAEEWYALTGGPIPPAGRSARQVHEAILRAAEQGLPEGLTADRLR